MERKRKVYATTLFVLTIVFLSLVYVADGARHSGAFLLQMKEMFGERWAVYIAWYLTDLVSYPFLSCITALALVLDKQKGIDPNVQLGSALMTGSFLMGALSIFSLTLELLSTPTDPDAMIFALLLIASGIQIYWELKYARLYPRIEGA